jgi:hypothetical protein
MTVKVFTNHRSRCYNHVNGWLPIEILIVKFAWVATTPNKPKGVNEYSQKGIWELQVLLQIENTDAKSDKSMLILIIKLSQSQIAWAKGYCK